MSDYVQQVDGVGHPKPEKKSEFTRRFVVLALGCIVMMCSYYCVDNPAALHDPLKRHFADQYTEKEFERYFNLMYSVYSLPNIILPLIGGLLIDRVGYRWMNMAFGCCLILGQCLFAAGVSQRDMVLLLVGRSVYGFGGECILVGLSSMLTDWFGGSTEFALVMGIKMSVARLGSVFNNVGSSAFYRDEGIRFAVWFGVIILGVAMLCLVSLLIIEAYTKSTIDRNIAYNKNIEFCGATSDFNGAPPVPSSDEITETIEEPVRPTGLQFYEIKNFTVLYWLLLVTCVLLYGAVIPFNHVSSAMIIQKFLCHGDCPSKKKQSWAEKRASFVMGIPFITTCVLSPLVGFCVDRFGGNSIMFIVSGFTLVAVHAILAASDSFTVLIFALIFLGLAYTIYASSLWPSVPTTLKPHQVGTGYGLMTAVQNVGLTCFPLIVAEIRADSGGYTWVEVFFACLALMGALIALYTLYYDKKRHNVLHMSATERNAWIESQKQRMRNVTSLDQLDHTLPPVDEDNTTLISQQEKDTNSEDE